MWHSNINNLIVKMKDNEVPKIPYSLLAFATNCSIRTVRAVLKGERNDIKKIKKTKHKIEKDLIKMRNKNLIR